MSPEYSKKKKKCPYNCKTEGDLITKEEVADVILEAEV